MNLKLVSAKLGQFNEESWLSKTVFPPLSQPSFPIISPLLPLHIYVCMHAHACVPTHSRMKEICSILLHISLEVDCTGNG